MAYSYFRNRDKVPYSVTHDRFLENDSPIRTAFPVNTLPPSAPTVPPVTRPSHGGSTGLPPPPPPHESTCM